MMKKDMEKGNMQEDTSIIEYASGSIKRKQRDTNLRSLFKIWYHWRLLISKPYGGGQKNILKKRYNKKQQEQIDIAMYSFSPCH